MNKRQVIILWTIALLLGAAVAFVKFGREKETKSATTRSAGQTLFESFPTDQIASIEIKGAVDSTTIVKKDGKWLLPQRDNFPAKTGGISSVNELLRTLAELKVTQGMQAGPSSAPRFGMDETSKNPKEHGISVTFKDASGKDLNTVTIGKNIESAGAAQSPMGGGGSTGRFIRNHADTSGFYAVGELFSSLSDEPKRWLAEDFINIEKIQSISVTQPGKSDIAWKVVRENEEGEFAIEGASAGETIDPATALAFKSLLSFTRFDDIVPATEVEKRAIADQKRVATIVTFEGFTYKITLTPSKPSDKPASANPEDPSPAAEETFLATVTLTGEVPKERKKEEGEKPEDAKTKDEAFATRSKELTDQLAREQAIAPFTFQVPKASFDSLIKDRAGLLKKPEAAAAPADQPARTFRVPQGGIDPNAPPLEAVTPPVEATTPPVGPEIELKPVPPAPPAEEKPAEPAPPAAE